MPSLMARCSELAAAGESGAPSFGEGSHHHLGLAPTEPRPGVTPYHSPGRQADMVVHVIPPRATSLGAARAALSGGPVFTANDFWGLQPRQVGRSGALS